MNKVIETITSRVSCRSYNDKKVPLSKLNQILEAGKYAPSGMNRQVSHILAIRSKGKLEKVRAALVSKFGRDCLYGANTLCIVYGKREEPLVVQDGSCILENMFIAANALHIDTCWINQLEDLLSDSNYKNIRKLLGISEDYRVIGSVILGYRKDKDIAIKARKEDFIRYL